MRQWIITLPNGRCITVHANTRSEARGRAKRVLGLKERLPPGTVIRPFPSLTR